MTTAPTLSLAARVSSQMLFCSAATEEHRVFDQAVHMGKLIATGRYAAASYLVVHAVLEGVGRLAVGEVARFTCTGSRFR